MSFLNQFYTPDYVVRFLVDNTLGRTWYEMRGGDTILRERCQLLVWRPDDQLAKRAKKQPHELLVIDPACGSGHFLLYAFEVLQTIYEEAYTDPDLGEGIQSNYDPDEYQRVVPAMIIEHNLHGIDIDRRATQIAALALYLKARTAHPAARVERANVVCAEPMPGDRDLFEAFKQRKLAHHRGTLSRLLDHAWEHLELAGEVGSVLLVDEEITAALAREKEQWQDQQARGGRPGHLFDEFRPSEQPWLDYSDVDSPLFWENAEAEIGKLLEEYAAEAEGAEGIRRRLFARDSARGLHFIEVMHKRYDVALMNPPFGAVSVRAKPYITTAYPLTKNDIYAVFVERFLQRLQPRGFLGAITSRTGFFLSSFQKWRERVILARSKPTVFADLGHGVMDGAMVEAAAYCLQRMD